VRGGRERARHSAQCASRRGRAPRRAVNEQRRQLRHRRASEPRRPAHRSCRGPRPSVGQRANQSRHRFRFGMKGMHLPQVPRPRRHGMDGAGPTTAARRDASDDQPRHRQRATSRTL
jgi:hypothetical protein